MYVVNMLGALVSVISIVGGLLTLNFKSRSSLLNVLGIGLIVLGVMCYLQYSTKLDYGINF
jgi:CHASE2 domain-containing sensor protein